MSSLFGSLSISLRALLAQQAALETTTDNIANMNTPGYSRRRAVLEEDEPVFNGAYTEPRGVHLEKIESIRDRVLQLRIFDETQQQSASSSLVNTMEPVEQYFADGDGTIGSNLDNFFSALSALSPDPSNAGLRTGVLTAAGNLANVVQTTANNLSDAQHQADRSITQAVTQVNQLTQQIAVLNQNISAKIKLGQDSGALEDQRDVIIRQLAGLVDVSVMDDTEGLTLSTSNGSPLVVGGKAFTLDTQLDASGKVLIYSQGSDITSTLKYGQIGGLLDARDNHIAPLISQLDTFAKSFTDAMNTAHAAGFDANGNAGGNLFQPIAVTQGAAASMSVAIQDPSLFAASSDGSAGDSGNLSGLLALQNSAIVDGSTPGDYYSSIVFQAGTSVANAKAASDAGDLMLQQLDNQRGSISGVSLDEETTNLLRFQRAYEAAARVVSVISDLTEQAINLGRN